MREANDYPLSEYTFARFAMIRVFDGQKYDIFGGKFNRYFSKIEYFVYGNINKQGIFTNKHCAWPMAWATKYIHTNPYWSKHSSIP